MGNRKSSGMKLVPVSPSACDTSLSDAEEPMPARSSEVEVRNLGEFMLKKMKKFEKNVAMVNTVIYRSFFLSFYAPNFEDVDAANWFRVVRACVRPFETCISY